jgi:hypothetical protein
VKRAFLSGSFFRGADRTVSICSDDRAALFRDDRFTGPIESTIRVNGSGAIGYDEYAGNYRMSPRFSVPLWGQRMRRGFPKNWLPWEEGSMMDGSLVLALVSIGAAILNGIGLLKIWKNVWDHFFPKKLHLFVQKLMKKLTRISQIIIFLKFFSDIIFHKYI